MRSLISGLSSIVAAYFLTACGNSNETEHHSEPVRKAVSSAELILPLIEKFESANFLGPCDQEFKVKMREIALAVDQHHAEIEEYTEGQAASASSGRFQTVKVGPIFVRERKLRIEPAAGWVTEHFGWRRTFEAYAQAQKDPSPANWSVVNYKVRSNLSNDLLRVVDGYAFVLARDSEPMLQLLIASAEACLIDSVCKFPTFQLDGLTWMNRQSDYSRLLETVRTSPDAEARKASLEKLIRWFKIDLNRYLLKPKPSVQRTGNVLHLPLSTHDFAEVRSQLAAYAESYWKSANLSIQIEWIQPAAEVFEVIFDPISGGRSHVLFNEHEVHLSNNIRASAIAHEIGHVLGFRDHYFELWNPSTCEYDVQSRNDDLMSDDYDSTVTEDEWQSLETAYPIQK